MRCSIFCFLKEEINFEMLAVLFKDKTMDRVINPPGPSDSQTD